MITQEEVEQGLRYMRQHAADLASAKANRIYITHYLTSCLAILYSEAPGEYNQRKFTSVEDRKNWALSQPQYLKQLDALKIAVQEEELHKWKMEAANAIVEVWRTQESTNRMIDRSHT